jgi:hypothetical protein
MSFVVCLIHLTYRRVSLFWRGVTFTISNNNNQCRLTMEKNVLKRIIIAGMVVGGLIILSSCAQREIVDSCLTGHQYGFWGGLWHGIIAPIDFVVMLFNHSITMYAQNNNGAWYAIGFLIGSGGWGFLGGKGLKGKS